MIIVDHYIIDFQMFPFLSSIHDRQEIDRSALSIFNLLDTSFGCFVIYQLLSINKIIISIVIFIEKMLEKYHLNFKILLIITVIELIRAIK